jgi:sigma-B regulation protein RsbU (phosphoserine phosphatase)
MSLLNPDGLRTASARVRSEARLLELSRDDFNALLRREPSLAFEMLSVLSRRLREAHNASILELTEKNRQLTQAYEDLKAAQEQIIEKKTLERELEQARDIQVSMMPTLLPKLAGFDIGARMLPARMVGGDFFDVIRLGHDSLGIVIGDVAGKGVPAALFMALTRSLLRAEAKPGMPPESVLQRVNHHLLGMNAKGLFVTVLYGILHRETREFVYARAGHEPPILWDNHGTILPVSLGSGQVLGLLLKPIIEPRTVTIPDGGGMLLVSDGVTEASNEQNDLFGSDRLDACIPNLLKTPTHIMLDRLLQILSDFRGSAPQADDITIIGVQANG